MAVRMHHLTTCHRLAVAGLANDGFRRRSSWAKGEQSCSLHRCKLAEGLVAMKRPCDPILDEMMRFFDSLPKYGRVFTKPSRPARDSCITAKEVSLGGSACRKGQRTVTSWPLLFGTNTPNGDDGVPFPVSVPACRGDNTHLGEVGLLRFSVAGFLLLGFPVRSPSWRFLFFTSFVCVFGRVPVRGLLQRSGSWMLVLQT